MGQSRSLFSLVALICFSSLVTTLRAAEASVTYTPPDGKDNGKRLVFLTGDEEYRSEEGLPMLAKILSQRHGFTCTVLFAVDADGMINPENVTTLSDPAALDSADGIVMLLRFRAWPDDVMKHFVDAVNRGVPIVALRTSTHAFNFKDGAYQNYNTFGKSILGEQWVNHWGKHKSEATRGVIEPGSKDDPILRGVTDIFGTSDVYEAYPPSDAKVLLRGQVLDGMTPDAKPADYAKKRADGNDQNINDPMMPIAWTRMAKNDAGKENKIFCTTMGAATDLVNEDLRRLIVNAVYAGVGMDVPAKADVALVGEYKPTAYGFQGQKKGVKPADLRLAGSESKSAATTTTAPATKPAANAGAFQFQPGDHIALVGSVIADRMQHFGWLETFLTMRHPANDLVFRNLAIAGDEVVMRHRSEGFGTPDEWLSRVKADVVFAFFGFNESFKAADGVEPFKKELDAYLKHLTTTTFGTKGPARVVLFSPSALEKLPDTNFSDPAARNANLKLYADAMRDVAAANGVTFVDLFDPSQALFAASGKKQPLTINELYLTEAGDREMATVIYRALVNETAPAGDVEKLRTAVNEKNAEWHARYRTVDGYNVYGGRSKVSYPSQGKEITNAQVMEEEMTQRDVLTANRDKLVWATAQGKPYTVDDSNLPPVVDVDTNKPGPDADKSFPYLGAEEAIAKMHVHEHCKVNVFASEEQFPELVNPVQMAWDTKGRLWVSVWPNYPERTPTSKTGDSLIILEDTDGDGKADKRTTFIDNLNSPTGFQFYKDGVLLMQAPDLWFIRDTDGDGKADTKERVLMGMDSADTHHTTNSMVLEPGGAVYLSDGIFHHSQVETPFGVVRNNDAGIYRFEPRTGRFDRYVPYYFMNPHGRVFDYWGNDLITDATGNNTYFGPAFSGHLDYPKQHKEMKEIWQRPSRPSPGTTLMTTRQFPEEFWGNLLNMNVISFQGIYRVKLSEEGSGIKGERQPDLISSDDPNFRPTAANVGPDGAVYFADWQNTLIGHLQHHLRDPNRDRTHGRVYRITYEGRPLVQQPKIDGQPIAALIELLKAPENQVRDLAKIELAKHETKEVIDAVNAWTAALDQNDPAYQHHLTEALWVHQYLNTVDLELLNKMLHSPDAHARAAATRVLCYWADRVPNALDLLAERVDDDSPRVRLEAVRAASFFSDPRAIEITLAALKQPTDYYLDYTINETMRQFEPMWRDGLAKGQKIATDNPIGLRYVMKSVATPELLKMEMTPATAAIALSRPELTDAERHRVVSTVAKSTNSNSVDVLFDALQAADEGRANVAKLLPQMLQRDLAPRRGKLVGSMFNDRDPAVRQYAWASVATGDGTFDTLWTSGTTPELQTDLLSCVPLVYDPFVRASAYDKLLPMIKATSDTLADGGALRPLAIRAIASIPNKDAPTFAALADLLKAGEDVPTCAAAMRSLQRNAFDAPRATDVARAIAGWAKQVPVDRRTEPDYVSTIQFVETLLPMLDAKDAASLLAEVKTLRVPAFFIRSVREQMRYDTSRLVVEAGKPFEITFENVDLMPHNVAIEKPGNRERIGAITLTMKPDQLDAAGRAYMPVDPAILAGTKLLENGQRETIKLTAPTEDGDYEYVCTYPDHWRVMYGTLVVTTDVDAYLLSHPEPPEVAPATMPAHHHGG